MADLTDATEFELVQATKHKKVGDDRDVTDDVSLDRWSPGEKDRLYMNGLKTGDGYLDLVDGDHDGDRWTKVDAYTEVDGDTLTVKVGRRESSPNYTLVIRLSGEAFVEDDEEDDETLTGVTDGGTPVDGEDVAELTVSRRAVSKALDDSRNIEADELLDALENVNDVLKTASDVIYSHYTEEAEGGREEWLIAENGERAALYVHHGEEWDRLLDEAGVGDEELGTAVKRAHQQQARYDGADENTLGAVDAMVVWQPDVADLVQAGLTLKEARAHVLRVEGYTQEEIAGEMNLPSTSAAKNTLYRGDQKVREAKRLVSAAGVDTDE